MKKILFTALSAACLSGGFAQTFLTKTCYRGAFAPAPAPMWTDNWTEWDPQNKVYPSPSTTITSNVTSNTTWSGTILLSAQCYVTGNSILTILPGTTILGDKSVTGAGLFITKGSQLIANGTESQPIVFTSNQSVGNRVKGDWGGIILLGKADNNTPGGINNIEGLPISTLTEFGVASSPDNNDNSGSLRYVRIEYGGYQYQQDKEINGLTFGAVGRGTTIDHIQVSYSNDDAYEWFGGSVNCKYLVSYRCLDDDFDTDFGFSGNIQFGLAIRDPQIADVPSVSTSEFFESDNNATGTTSTPVTSAMFSNMTCIGPLRGSLTATVAAGHRSRARIRRNSALKIYNSILTDQATRGLFIDGSASETNASLDLLKFKNNIVAGYGQRATESGTFGIINANTFIAANANDTSRTMNAASFLVNPYSYTSPDYRPSAGSMALSNVSFTDAVLSAATGTVASQVLVYTPATFCIGDGTVISSPAMFAATSTLSTNYCSLTWSASPGVTISNSTAVNPNFTISTVGTFTVYMTIADGNGMTTGMSVVTTNTCTDVSVKETKNFFSSVKLAPNPSKDMATLFLNAQGGSALSVNVYDITGKIVLSPVQNQNLNNGENKFTITTSELQNGIYFVTLTSSNGKETVKLVVNK